MLGNPDKKLTVPQLNALLKKAIVAYKAGNTKAQAEHVQQVKNNLRDGWQLYTDAYYMDLLKAACKKAGANFGDFNIALFKYQKQ